MIPTLLLHDRLAPPKNHDAFWEVLDAQPRGGCIKVFDAAERADRYIKVTDIHDDKREKVAYSALPSAMLTMIPESAFLTAFNNVESQTVIAWHLDHDSISSTRSNSHESLVACCRVPSVKGVSLQSARSC